MSKVTDGRIEVLAGALAGNAKARFMALTGAAGVAACLFSAWNLRWAQLDWSFAVVALVTVFVGARAIVKIPRVKGEVTATDTFIFLTMLLYDGEAAVLLAVVEAVFSSLRITKTWLTVFFNVGLMGCSTFAAVWPGARSSAASPRRSRASSGGQLGLVCALALTQYAANSALAAGARGGQDSKSVWHTWKSGTRISTTTVASASATTLATRLNNRRHLLGTSSCPSSPSSSSPIRLPEERQGGRGAGRAGAPLRQELRRVEEQERIRVQFLQVENSAIGSLASGVATTSTAPRVIRGARS